MAISERYGRRKRIYNTHALYKKTFQDRGLTRVLQYETAYFRYPTVSEMSTLELVSHEWRVGDHYWKLANIHYQDPQLWWVIAWFNQAPTESFIQYGDIIEIPHPIEKLFQICGV